uniref:Fibronectin type-III domain-containing protein n=1 Tax=Gasterosteus aculeatus aculeatus TaxID=481459 RepID=A0AAQ4PUA1_GASAC|nr:interleukin-6 receptor subunit beta [Gasterosteus aculeatus aculeatus]
MVRGGFHLDFLPSTCSSCATTLQFFIFGLILVYYTTPFSSEKCKSHNVSSRYHDCGTHPDGVRDLDCFRKRNAGNPVCVWKPGRLSSENTYTLIVRQPKNYCYNYSVADFSKTIKIFRAFDLLVEVFEHSKSSICTKANFSQSPLVRCGPPSEVTFSRLSGGLLVDVSWPREDAKAIGKFSVSYKAPGSRSWSEGVISLNATTCRVDDLNSSLVYSVRIRCVTSKKCPQCAVSEAYTVPPELTSRPLIVDLQDTDIEGRRGSRLLSLTWKFPARELHDGYRVTVGKASGEPPQERITTSRPEITLIISHSAYRLAISAVNNASTSPAVSRAIPRREGGPRTADGKLNVTVHSDVSFTISWKDDLVKTYVCFCAEWRRKGHEAAYKSFYQNRDNHRTLSPLSEPLEPFKRYSITLHTRPNKDTCNMDAVNNSESTYGTVQFYFAEGPPVAAPANISGPRVTLDSAALQWSSIPEEDARGFLRGYVIHYNELHHGRPGTERNVTVDPTLNSFELRNLESGTAYEVQMSGFTAAGEGVRSPATRFKTEEQESSHLRGIITIFAVVATVLMFGPVIIRRAKAIVWPSIPNPEKSNAMQNIEEPCDLELLESITTLKVEEWDTASLRLVEKQSLSSCSEGEGDSDWIRRDGEDSDGEVPRDATGGAIQDLRGAPLAPPGGYTTLDMFQRATESRPVTRSGMDYIGQFSTSLLVDGEAAEM